jgi:hypothetical protein
VPALKSRAYLRTPSNGQWQETTYSRVTDRCSLFWSASSSILILISLINELDMKRTPLRTTLQCGIHIPTLQDRENEFLLPYDVHLLGCRCRWCCVRFCDRTRVLGLGVGTIDRHIAQGNPVITISLARSVFAWPAITKPAEYSRVYSTNDN